MTIGTAMSAKSADASIRGRLRVLAMQLISVRNSLTSAMGSISMGQPPPSIQGAKLTTGSSTLIGELTELLELASELATLASDVEREIGGSQ